MPSAAHLDPGQGTVDQFQVIPRELDGSSSELPEDWCPPCLHPTPYPGNAAADVEMSMERHNFLLSKGVLT
jgi:hypothetical protein